MDASKAGDTGSKKISCFIDNKYLVISKDNVYGHRENGVLEDKFVKVWRSVEGMRSGRGTVFLTLMVALGNHCLPM